MKNSGAGRAGQRAGGGGRSKQDVCDWNPESPCSRLLNRGIRTGALLQKSQGDSLARKIPAQDAPGNAQAGVEGADRMSATGTPSPPVPKNGTNLHYGRDRVIKKLTAMKKAVLFGAVREWPNRAPC